MAGWMRLIKSSTFVVPVFLASLLLLLSLGQHKASALTHFVSGTVTNAATSAPISSTVVQVYNPGTNTLRYSVTTGGSGTYNVSVEAGTYDFRFVPPAATGLNSPLERGVTVGGNLTLNKQISSVRHTFSGVLTDQNGTSLSNMSVTLRDFYGYSVSGTTITSSGFSLSVQPGTYSLRISGFVTGLGNYALEQPFLTPSIDMTGGNLSQNLQLKLATVNYTAYDAQGYKESGARVNNNMTGTFFSSVSLYAGDVGYAVTYSTTISAGSQSNFKSVVGVTYPSNALCVRNVSNVLIGCRTTPLDIPSLGSYSVDLPQAPPAPHTFSGTLTTSDGTPISAPNTTLQLRDAFGHTVSGGITSGSNFSLAVQPGIYSLRVSGFINGLGTFILEQNIGSPTIDLTGGNLARNLQIPLSTVNYTAYNAQGYISSGSYVSHRIFTTFAPVSLYPGDSGYTTTFNSTSIANGQGGVGSFKSIIGVTYSVTTGFTGNHLCVQNASAQFVGCITTPLAITNAVHTLNLPQSPAPTRTFSGTLTGNGTPLSNFTVTLRDAFDNVVSATTNASGNFSLAVQPGMYALEVNGSTSIFRVLVTLKQNNATPTINLTSSNVIQNLQIEFGKIDYNTYNAQGYVQPSATVVTRLADNGTIFPVSLYPGDSGYRVTVNGFNSTASPQGIGSFYSIVGVTYPGSVSQLGDRYICDHLPGGSGFIGCVSTPFTVTSGTSNLDIPKTPLPPVTFSGTLTASDGSLITNGTVSLRDAASNIRSATVNANGFFSVSVQPGMYAVSAGGTIAGMGTFGLVQDHTTPTMNLTGSVVQNLQVEVATIDYTTNDPSTGMPRPFLKVHALTAGGLSQTASLYPGDPSYTITLNSSSVSSMQADSQGKGSFRSVVGATYGTTHNNGICEYFSSTLIACITSPFTVASGFNNLVIPQIPLTGPSAPTGLTAVSPTTLPVLSWQAVSGAYQYRVYRNGVMVGATFNTSFGNANLPAGTYSYYVTAVAGNGGESAPSNVISVTVEAVPPILSTPNLSPGEIVVGASVNVSVNVSGNMSGFLGGEYFIGADPGEGNGTSMSFNNTLTATLNGLLPGNYTVNVRARNGAGWSSIVSAVVKVATLAPANLSGESPTHSVVIIWDSVQYASGYDVYRNGGKIATVLTNTFTDLTAPIGANTYFVKALNPDGHPSAQSNVINVTYSGPLHTVNGQVIFDGTAAPGVLVDLNQVAGPSDFDVTDESGTYVIHNTEDGNYSVTVSNSSSGASVVSAGAPNHFELTSGFPFVVVNGGGVTQNLSFDTSAITITVKNGQGLLMNGSKVTIVNTTDGLVFTTDGHVFNLAEADLRSFGSTGPGGTVVLYAFPGATYQVCASFPQLNTMSSSQPYCAPLGLTVNGDLSYEFVLPSSYNLSGHISFGGENVSQGGAKVIIRPADGSIQQVVLSDVSGNYFVDYLPDGTYDLEFVNNGSGAGGHIPQSWYFAKDAAITINGANATQNLEFATKLVTVTVLDEAGDLVNDVIAYLKSKSSNPITTLDSSLTFDFAFNTTVASGTTIVGQTVLGVFSGQSYEACAIVSTGTYCNPVYLFVDADKSILVVAADTYVVTGTVSVDGNSIPQGTNVTLTNNYEESGTVDANGAYLVNNLVNGDYNTTVQYSGPSNSSVTTRLPDAFSLTSSQRYATLNGANATHDLDFVGTYPLVVNVFDGSNTLIAGSRIVVTGSGSILTSDGLMLFTLGSLSKATSVTDGSPVLYLFAGVTYSVCAVVNGGSHCATYTVTPTGNNVATIRVASPTGISLAPITPYPQNPVLTWVALSSAVSYNIYRDNTETPIASVTGTSFTDTTVTEGTYTYYVQAVYPGDNLSELSLSKSTIVDRTVPVLASVSWSNNPSLFGSTMPVVTGVLTDNLTDIVAGEYFVGETDPGIGQGIGMGAPEMTITASFGFLGYPPGTYLVTMRGRDAAGLWSNTTTTTLVVEHPAPTNLTSEPITYVPPTIAWSTVDGSQSYTIYRNGIDVASRLTNSFTDEGAVAGSNVYTVVAISLLGIQSAHSEPLSVVYDPFPPTITAVYQPEPSNGWNNSPVTVSFICASVYGIVTCPESVTVSQDGADQPITVTATDVLGGSTTVTAYVDLDQLAPAIDEPSLGEDVLYPGQTTTLTVSATDDLSGVAGGEYFIGADPGQGSGLSMQWNGTSLAANFGSLLAPGVYTISIRAVDVAGNWSGVVTVVLTIVLNAPTNLAAASPTQASVLTWTGSDGAVSYNVYRNGSLVGNVSDTNFIDMDAPDGTNTYYVTAVDVNYNESEHSDTISVLVNTVPPTTTATLSPTPYAQDGTYPDPVTVTLNASPTSGLTIATTYYTVDGGAQQTYAAPFTVLGPGSHIITYWSVDNAGVTEVTNTTSFTVHTNLAPAINALTNASVNEGANFSQNGSFGDYDSTTWSAIVDYGDGSGVQQLALSGTNFSLAHTYADNGVYTVTVTITDGQGANSTATTTVTVNNVAPVLGDITGIPLVPIQINSSGNAAVSASITFTDPGMLDTHTVVWSWGDGTTSTGLATEANGAGAATGSHNYTSPGIYTVEVTITDNGGLSTTQYFRYVAVYDEDSMFTAVTKFNSPAGAYLANPQLTGQVDFSVHVKYNNDGMLAGTVSMNFNAGNIRFNATGFVMLVCTELGRATLTGMGSVNGVGGYTFFVTGIDKTAINGNKIRFQIVSPEGVVVYDTQPGADITATPTTQVVGVVMVKD